MEYEDISDGFSEWEQIESPFSCTNKAQSNNNDNTNSNSIVARDDDFTEFSVFPPNNHQDLPTNAAEDSQCLQAPEPSDSSVSSVSFLSECSSDMEGEEKEMKSEAKGRMKTRFRNLSTKIVQVASMMRNFTVAKVGCWSFPSAKTGAAAVMLALLYLLYVKIKRWRRQVLIESREHLMLLIREKDQKIKQLLLQIRRLNEFLLAPRKVPVFRVG